jgi:hypothetical protein
LLFGLSDEDVMFKPTLIALGIASMLGTSLSAFAADAPTKDQQLQQLHEEMQQLRQDYEQRLKSLEERLTKTEAAATPVIEVPSQTPFAPPAPVASASSGNAFNPKISLILDGAYANFSSRAPQVVPGFLLSNDAKFRPDGLSLGETELAVESNIDDQFHGWITISLKPEGGVSVEEAFINTLALPAGFALKFGRFFSDIGYQNHQHAHAWEFVDAPLVYSAMLGNQLGDDGLQLRWVAPTDLLVEFGTELTRGGAFPSGGDDRKGIRGFTAFAHVGGDVGLGGAWRVGLSHLRADADNRLSGDGVQTSFTGNSDLTILDGIYKWAPNGNPDVTNFVAQAEYFYRSEGGTVIADPTGAANSSLYNGHQRGFYVQGVYQFMPRWRTGLRYDRLGSSNSLSNPLVGTSLDTLADNGSAPQRWSLMTDFSNSEFSRIRVQFNRDESRPGLAVDNQIFLQYIFSLGSHPAHQF